MQKNKLTDYLKSKLVKWLLGKEYQVVNKHELLALNSTVENKFLLEKKIELWYSMYKGENFAKFFGLKLTDNV